MSSRNQQKGFALLFSIIISLAVIIVIAVGIYFGYSRQKGLVQTGTEGIEGAKEVQEQSQDNAQQMQNILDKIQ